MNTPIISDFKESWGELVMTKEKLESKMHTNMLSPLIPENRISMLNSNAGNGKTSLANEEILFIAEKYKNKRIVYLDYDAGFHRSNARQAQAIVDMNNIAMIAVDSKATHEQVIKMVKTHQDLLLVIDGFQTLCDYLGYDIKKEDMSRLMQVFKGWRDKHNFTIILIHHNTKQDKVTGKSSFRGNPVIEDSLDCRYEVKGSMSEEGYSYDITVEKYSGSNEVYKGMTLHKKDGKYSTEINTELVLPTGIDKVLLLGIVANNCDLGKSALKAIVSKKLSIGVNKSLKALNTLITIGDIVECKVEGTNKKVLTIKDKQ